MELEQPDKGKITVGETVTIGYYSQEGLQLNEDKRVLDTVREVADYLPLAGGRKLMAAQLLENFLLLRY